MNTEKLTEKSKEVLEESVHIAYEHKHSSIEPLHVLRALFEVSETIIAPLLSEKDISISEVQKNIDEALMALPKLSQAINPQITPAVVSIFRRAEKEATSMKDEYISVEHILLALGSHDGVVKEILEQHNLLPKQITASITELRGSARITNTHPEDKNHGLHCCAG